VALTCDSLMISDVEHLFTYLSDIFYVIFAEMSILVLCPIKNQVRCFLATELYEFFITLGK
jgi:hypothetical protein